MDIKAEEYVRTKKGDICKVLGISPELKSETRIYSYKKYYLDNKKGSLTEFYIAKHSKNIIDLIEVGDFVNGYLVTDKYLFAGEKPVLETTGEDTNCKCMCEQDIQTILTKEQYNQNCYKLGTKQQT